MNEHSKPAYGIIGRAKIVAKILTDNGHEVTAPDEASLDDVEMARWNICVEIVRALIEADDFVSSDPWRMAISDWIDRNDATRCTASEVFHAAICPHGDVLAKRDATRIRDIFRRMKWVTRRVNGVNTFYRPGCRP